MGTRKNWETDGEKLLGHLFDRVSLRRGEHYIVDYCYVKDPPARASDRRSYRDAAFCRIFSEYLSFSQHVVIGMGHQATDVLLHVGKTKLKEKVGVKWRLADYPSLWTWISYDPAGAVFDPNLCVDIAGVINQAMLDAKIPHIINKNPKPYEWPI